MVKAIEGVAKSAERLRMLLANLPINSDIITRESSLLSLWLSRYSIASADYRIITASREDEEEDAEAIGQQPSELLADLLQELKPYLKDRMGNGGYELN